MANAARQLSETEISKFLSKVLRHTPEEIGITLDRNGWVDIATLLSKAKKANVKFDRAMLDAVVENNDKSRFSLSMDGRRIRAAQGHSVQVDLGLEQQVPPPVLFHGTASQNLHLIFAEGLKPGRRQQVHLSSDEELAALVGHRHGKAVVLRVDAVKMYADGKAFYCADNGVWLTDFVEAIYLSL
jgi:putative RNA 2'-phosphotransferase